MLRMESAHLMKPERLKEFFSRLRAHAAGLLTPTLGNPKRAAIVLLFLAFVTALAVVSEFTLRNRSDSESGGGPDRLIAPAFRPEDVRTIEISWSNRMADGVRVEKSTLSFNPDGKYWALKERGGAQAASSQIAELLENLSKIEPLKALNISGVGDYMDLHLVSDREVGAADEKSDPKRSELEKSEGILVVLRDERGTELLRMMLGAGHNRAASDRIGIQPGQDPVGRYIRIWYSDRDDAGRVYLISRLFKTCVPKPVQWIEQLHLYKPDNPWSAEFLRKRPGAEDLSMVWSVETDEAGGRFRSEFPRGEFDLDQFSQKFQALASPFSVDRMENLPEDLQFGDVFHAVMRDGFDYKLELAKAQVKGDGEPDIVCIGRLTVSFDPDRVRPLIGEPDDALEHRKKQLASRAEYEMRTANGHVFLLKNGLLELLAQPPVRSLPRTSASRPAGQSAPKKEE